MAVIDEGGFSFKNAAGQLTRKGRWKIEDPLGNHKLKVTVEYADVTTSFVDGGLTWYVFAAGNGAYEPNGETVAAYDTYKANHAGSLNVHSHVWWPEGS